jgi:SpoVK/Ycf46/Vps4 family AAA+-type ATPase
MARSDLLESLVKAGANGDKRVFRMATEAIIAEERAKRHDVLANRLLQAMQTPNGNGSGNGHRSEAYGNAPDPTHRGRDFVAEVVPRRTLDDLILPIAARQVILDLVEEQRRADLLRAHGLEPRHRILLVGAPGTGKTTLAEAIAEAIAVPLFVVRYESMIGSYLGETAARLKRVFDYARTTPCVLFFDEFDAIGKERGDIHETGEIKRVVTSLLMQVDELPSYTIVAAATNHPELLDRAAWRRFQIRLDLPLPKQRELARYIDSFLSRFGVDKCSAPLNIARALGRISYAEAEQFCLDVRRRQILANGEKSLKDLIAEQVEIWSSVSRAKQPREKEGCNAGASASSDPKSERG